MDKSTLLLAAIILAVFGASVAAGHPHWGTFTGIAIILLAAGLAAGALPLHSQDFVDERTGPTQRISNGLITLSSAAIVAVYAAGYHRTSPAAHRFDSQIPQQRTSAAVVVATPTPALPNPSSNAAPPVSSSASSTDKKSTKRPSTPPRPAAPNPASDPAASSSAASTPEPSTPAINPPAEAAAPPMVAAKSAYKDGVFAGWGSCRHGDIEASVTIQDGKIALVAISQCLTRYSCGWIAPKIPGAGLPDLPSQVVERQSPKVDYVSGATESSYAFADAVVAALAKATE